MAMMMIVLTIMTMEIKRMQRRFRETQIFRDVVDKKLPTFTSKNHFSL